MRKLWPHQQRCLDEIRTAMAQGVRNILVAAPTGAGKSEVMQRIMGGQETYALYTDRTMLMEQLADDMRKAGFDFGIRAPGYPLKVLPKIQICMVQTEHSRVTLNEEREHHDAKIVLIDEAHKHKSDMIRNLLERHKQDGATIIGFTATPLDLGDMYDKLIVAATNTECRQCGAHVPAHTYAPDEPDLKNIKRMATGDYEVGALAKLYRRPVIFGRVYEHWKKLNPDGRTTILFGPDVSGSLWFAEQFEAKGVPTGHIDGERVVIRGETHPANKETRHQLLEAWKSGEIAIVTNRFVLREGIDVPEIYHGILATAFGALTPYIQAGGRILRAHPSLDHVVIQDHGGNWHRHGSLNADRQWELDATDRITVKEREERMRNKEESGEREPIVCPTCAKVRSSGNQCPHCGHMSAGKTRVVVQTDGKLREVKGDVYRKRRVSQDPADVQAWKQCYFRCKNAKKPMSFNQAAALFMRENGGKWPDPSWPLMPKDEMGKYRKIKDVPMSELNGATEGRAA